MEALVRVSKAPVPVERQRKKPRGSRVRARPIAAEPIRVSRNLLLGLYAIIPIAFAVATVDLGFFGGSLRASLPYSPDELLAFAVFFNLPHIIASTVSFADVEYLKHYRAKILIPVAVLAGTLLLEPRILETPWFSGILYLWTVIHVIGQQFGMIRLMGKVPGKQLDLWKWTGIALGTAVYVGTYVTGKEIGRSDEWLRNVTLVSAWLLSIPFAWLAWRVHSLAGAGNGKRAVVANFSMIGSILVLYTMGYSFFLILIPRVIHDLSAFVFYVTHDRNRNRSATPNFLYRGFRRLGIPMNLLSPGLALIVAFPLTYYYLNDVTWAYRIAVAVTVLHYYTDRFVWKSGSPFRRFITVLN